MTFKEFLGKVKDAFFNAVVNAIGSTTFWVFLISVVLVCFKVIAWESVLATAGIYGAKRYIQDSRFGKAE